MLLKIIKLLIVLCIGIGCNTTTCMFFKHKTKKRTIQVKKITNIDREINDSVILYSALLNNDNNTKLTITYLRSGPYQGSLYMMYKNKDKLDHLDKRLLPQLDPLFTIENTKTSQQIIQVFDQEYIKTNPHEQKIKEE